MLHILKKTLYRYFCTCTKPSFYVCLTNEPETFFEITMNIFLDLTIWTLLLPLLFYLWYRFPSGDLSSVMVSCSAALLCHTIPPEFHLLSAVDTRAGMTSLRSAYLPGISQNYGNFRHHCLLLNISFQLDCLIFSQSLIDAIYRLKANDNCLLMLSFFVASIDQK